jgi:putative mRNA 3-end processing factor
VKESGARRVYVTHGQSDVLARYLRDVEGLDAEPIEALPAGRVSSADKGN